MGRRYSERIASGKTTRPALIKELKLREAVERCLILVPAPLTIQWQDELPRFFNEPFRIVHSPNDHTCCAPIPASGWRRTSCTRS